MEHIHIDRYILQLFHFSLRSSFICIPKYYRDCDFSLDIHQHDAH